MRRLGPRLSIDPIEGKRRPKPHCPVSARSGPSSAHRGPQHREPVSGRVAGIRAGVAELEFGPRKEVLRVLAGLPPPQPETPCRLHPLARIARFRHDPAVLLGAAATDVFPPDIAVNEALLVLSVRDPSSGFFSPRRRVTSSTIRIRRASGVWPRGSCELLNAGLLVPPERPDDGRTRPAKAVAPT